LSTSILNQTDTPAQSVAMTKSAGSRKWILAGIKIMISASLIIFLVSKSDVSAIWHAMLSANLVLIILSFLLHGVGYFSSVYRWQLLLKAQGYYVSVGYLLRSYAVAMFFNNLLPSTIGGDGYRAYDTSKCNIPKLKALACVVVERFLGMFALMVFAILALSLATELTTKIENLWFWSFLTFSVMAVGVYMIFFHSGKVPFLRKILDQPVMKFVNKQVMKITESFAPFRGKTKALSWAMALSLLLQLNVIFHYFLISASLGLSIPFVKFLVIIPLAMFIQMVPISINGIGLRESFYVFFLTKIYGVPIEASLAFSWIAYGMILLLGILGGIIYMFRK